jgi:hypothetical protein
MRAESVARVGQCEDCLLVNHTTLEAEHLVGIRVLLESFRCGRAHDLDVGAVAHQGLNAIIRDAAAAGVQGGEQQRPGERRLGGAAACGCGSVPIELRIGAELSHGPGHASRVVHLGSIQKGGNGGKAEGPDAAHDLVVDDPTALGHENKVDRVAGVALDQRKAVDDGHVDLCGIVGAARNDDGVLAHF